MSKSKKEKYKIILTVSGVDFKGDGQSFIEAFEKLNVTWKDITGKGIFNVSFGKASHEKIFNVFQLRRLFGNKYVRNFWIDKIDFLIRSQKQ